MRTSRTWRPRPTAAAIIVSASFVTLMTVAPPVALAAGTWTWPATGPVIRGFDPPLSPYGSGHRGIDIGVPQGSAIAAPAGGVVTFAGKVGGQLFLTIDHGGGVSSTYSWLTTLGVHKGDRVAEGQVVATTGAGHPGDVVPSLHMGVKLNGAYVDPLDYLSPIPLTQMLRLAPLAPG